MPDKMQHEAVADLLFPPDPAETPSQRPRADNPEVDHQVSADGPEGVDRQEPPEDQAADEAATPAEVPDTLEAIADKAGLKVKDLYNVKIPMPAGEEPITLGQFKDRIKDLRRADTIAAEAEDTKATLQAERLQFQQELATVAQALQSNGGKLSRDALEQASQSIQRYQEQQRALAEKVAPELSKPEVLDGMAEVVSQYGISRQVFDQIHEAPFRLMMHRLYTLENRLKAAKAQEAKPRQSKPQPRQGQSRSEKRQHTVAAAKAGRIKPEEAIANLIFGDN